VISADDDVRGALVQDLEALRMEPVPLDNAEDGLRRIVADNPPVVVIDASSPALDIAGMLKIAARIHPGMPDRTVLVGGALVAAGEGGPHAVSRPWKVGRLGSAVSAALEAGRAPDAAIAVTRDVRPDDLAPGSVVDERYEVVGLLGRGGSAAVYHARDLRLREEVAVKLLSAAPEGGTAADRFLQEIRICRSLGHPNVIALHGDGSWEGRPYLVMELLRGTTLLDRAPAREAKALRWIAEAAAGLAAVHARGVVHRDIKPSNLFLTTEDVVKLMDFGSARADDFRFVQTDTGLVVGTAGYLSPERIEHSRTDTAASDIWGLGIVLFELITGEQAFPEAPLATMLLQIRRGEVPDFEERVAPFHPATIKVLRALLRPDPDTRPSAAKVASAVAMAASRLA